MIAVLLNTLLDAVATLYVVVPYRNAIRVLLANLKKGKVSFEPVAPAANQAGLAAIFNNQL